MAHRPQPGAQPCRRTERQPAPWTSSTASGPRRASARSSPGWRTGRRPCRDRRPRRRSGGRPRGPRDRGPGSGPRWPAGSARDRRRPGSRRPRGPARARARTPRSGRRWSAARSHRGRAIPSLNPPRRRKCRWPRCRRRHPPPVRVPAPRLQSPGAWARSSSSTPPAATGAAPRRAARPRAVAGPAPRRRSCSAVAGSPAGVYEMGRCAPWTCSRSTARSTSTTSTWARARVPSSLPPSPTASRPRR